MLNRAFERLEFLRCSFQTYERRTSDQQSSTNCHTRTAEISNFDFYCVDLVSPGPADHPVLIQHHRRRDLELPQQSFPLVSRLSTSNRR